MERSKTVDPGRELRHPLMMVSARRLPEKEEIPPDGLPGFRDRILVFVVVLFFLWKALHWMPAHDDAAFMGLSRESLFLDRHRSSLFVNARISFRAFWLDGRRAAAERGDSNVMIASGHISCRQGRLLPGGLVTCLI